MTRLTVIFAGAATIAAVVLGGLTAVDPTYEAKTAAEKLSLCWSSIIANPTSGKAAGITDLAYMLIQSMKPTISYASDTLPSGRNKPIRSQGVVAKLKFTWNKDVITSLGYTGQFASDVTNALGRASSAKMVDYTKPTGKASFGPGFSFKLFRDAVPSSNLMAMYKLQEVDSHNFFGYPLSNHMSSQNLDLGTWAVAKKFSTVTTWTSMVGCSDIASYTATGQKVDKPVFPFQLIFVPDASVEKRFARDYTPGNDFMTQFKRDIKIGTTIYQIHAINNPFEAPVIIGQVVTVSDFTTSNWGDSSLFFKHQIKEEDFALRPDWLKACPDYKNCGVCPVDQACGTATTTYSATNKANPGASTKSLVNSANFKGNEDAEAAQVDPAKSDVPLIVGLSVGGVVVIVIALIVIAKRRQRGPHEVEAAASKI